MKVALENYLQAILSLPVKDRNEIAAFFTSDIVRARQPVASAGYKEGYLTKRGKNFGGWKRRYFVLQGSVLEYYESVRPFILSDFAYLTVHLERWRSSRIDYNNWSTDRAAATRRDLPEY